MDSKLCHNIRLLGILKFIQLIFYTLSGSKLGNNKYSTPEKPLVIKQSVNRHLNKTRHDNLCFYWLVNEKFSSEFGKRIMKFFESIIMWFIVPSTVLALRHKHFLCVGIGRSENTRNSRTEGIYKILCPAQIPMILIICNVMFWTVPLSRCSLLLFLRNVLPQTWGYCEHWKSQTYSSLNFIYMCLWKGARGKVCQTRKLVSLNKPIKGHD